MLKTCVFVVFSVLFSVMFFNVCEAEKKQQTYEIHFIREYLDGERSVEVVKETATSVYDIINAYRDWDFIGQNNQVITLSKKVNEWSPLMKTNGYFIFDEYMLPLFQQFHINKLESRHILYYERRSPFFSASFFDDVFYHLD